jgi:uncharacterized protein (DUF1800 family)
MARTGKTAWVASQLRPNDSETWELANKLRGIEVERTPGLEVADIADDHILLQMQQAAILRAVYSPHQLRERMADFWTNHFNIYAHKGFGAYYKPLDERLVVRKHALGKFPDMLRASSKSPAMMAYLDNQLNRKRDPKGQGANENYAREIMELHTLGVGGGYTQKDVTEVARCFSGWTVEGRLGRARGTFRFDPDLHDDGEKLVLGQRIPAGGGIQDGERVVEILAFHPSTARYIGRKLSRYFLGEGASPSWEERLAGIYLKTSGDIPSMLEPLLLSDELTNSAPILKRPFDYVVSSLRATAAATDGAGPLQKHLDTMGQPLYQWPTPDGYPVKTSAWSGSLLARWNFALALTSKGIPGTDADVRPLLETTVAHTDRQAADTLVELVTGQRPSESNGRLAAVLRAHLENGSGSSSALSEATALAVASPEMMWR